MIIRCKGKHSHLKKPEGGALWNALELNCRAAAFPQETVLTSRGIRKALKKRFETPAHANTIEQLCTKSSQSYTDIMQQRQGRAN